MKTSRRHRWVKIDVDQELCRDCGLEQRSDHVRGGGLGSCAGKACEFQHALTLSAQEGHDLGNRYPGDYLCSCVGCGAVSGLMMVAHHHPETGKMTGWVFECSSCLSVLKDSTVTFTPKEKSGE